MTDLPCVETELVNGEVVHASRFARAHFKNWNNKRMNVVVRDKGLNNGDFRVLFSINNEAWIRNDAVCFKMVNDMNCAFNNNTLRNAQRDHVGISAVEFSKNVWVRCHGYAGQ